ncbi:MAG: 3-methyl-2-oxobutanoate hydroxymethyltransferase [Planctomycetes bacterium]|nr:3-methyl-2-oxobutanoate hydroxymethyltransferase [Planctomycetota bacterium]
MIEKITIAQLLQARLEKRKIAAISCYDYTTAKLVAKTDIEMILVGDSAAQMMLGFDSTLPVTMDFMVTITAAVRRAAPDKFLVADMPFLSYQLGVNNAVKNAGRFVTEAGVQMIKIEASEPYLNVIKAVSDAGMAVMAHIGIRPQMVAKTGKLKAEGTTAEMAVELVNLAEQMIRNGASFLLLEGTAAEVSKIITERFDVPVISCGAGPDCDGQILIAPDVLGLIDGPKPKFAKSYAQFAPETIKALTAYNDEVKNNSYPDDLHSYHMKKGEFEKLQQILK